MFYTIYKITNTINDKYYIGMHQTKNIDDNYFGSGKALKYAIDKYGKDKFIKEILFVFDNEADMRNKEKELVVINENTYNLLEGGKGGFGYINTHIKVNRVEAGRLGGKRCSEKHKDLQRQWGKNLRNNPKWKLNSSGLFPNARKGIKASNELKNKLSLLHTGNCNSQHGTMWITNGTQNKKIKKELDIIPEGWYKGRVIIK